mmetsp:Transcript_35085/g.52365  ORF Transcript_35085/g.52365 Transcript_35085/m.52365 type:complete len:832 (-) Transcript_35085:253-2748(-)
MKSVASDDGAVSNVGSRIEAALASVQPIRDLARNWDIDIASCLEDYLKEIVHIGHLPPLTQQSRAILSKAAKESNGSNSAPPNFAQAALLLQNSSCVYSRKVEYLHSLVYSYLNEMVASTRNNNKESGLVKKPGGRPNDALMDEFNAFDPEMEFLLLDDILPTDESPGGVKINLVEGDGNGNEGLDNMDLDDEDNNVDITHIANDTMNNNITQLSLGGLSVTRIDRSALGVPADSDGISAAMTSAAAERALMGTLMNEGTDIGGGNLRLLSEKCDICASGALLMPGSSITDNSDINRRETMGTNVSAFDITVDPSITAVGEVPAVVDSFANNEEDLVQCNDDDHDEGVGFELCENSVGDEVGVTFEVCNDVSENDVPPTADQKTILQKKKSDPWLLLDPHDAGSSKPRPLKIGVTYRLPPGFKDTPSASVTGARTKKSSAFHLPGRRRILGDSILGDGGCLATATFEATISAAVEAKRKRQTSIGSPMNDCDDENDMSNKKGSFLSKEEDITTSDEYAHKRDRLAQLATVPLKGLAFGDEFAYIAKADAKRRAAERREQRKVEENDLNSAVIDNHHLNDFGNDENEGGEYDFGGADDDSFGGNHSGYDGADHEVNRESLALGPQSNTCMTSLDDAFSRRVSAGEHMGFDAAFDSNTFEALCRAHIKAFSRGAERYAAETNLSRRVGDWQRRLAPILEEEEQRAEFDIHSYGHRILERIETEIKDQRLAHKKYQAPHALLSSQSNVVDFQSVTNDCTQFEVCRLFMASLMLSNSGNVLLSRDGTESEEAATSNENCLRIELLKSNFELPMETYLVPSTIVDDNTGINSVEVS